jgi:transposase
MKKSSDEVSKMKSHPLGVALSLEITAQEEEALKALTKSHDREEADRARIVLKLQANQNSSQIAKDLGLHPVAIRRIKRRFLKSRLLGIPTKKSTGRPPIKREAILDCLRSLDICGRLQSNQTGVFSTAQIAHQVEQDKGIKVHPSTVRSALKKGDIAGVGCATVSEASAVQESLSALD